MELKTVALELARRAGAPQWREAGADHRSHTTIRTCHVHTLPLSATLQSDRCRFETTCARLQPSVDSSRSQLTWHGSSGCQITHPEPTHCVRHTPADQRLAPALSPTHCKHLQASSTPYDAGCQASRHPRRGRRTVVPLRDVRVAAPRDRHHSKRSEAR